MNYGVENYLEELKGGLNVRSAVCRMILEPIGPSRTYTRMDDEKLIATLNAQDEKWRELTRIGSERGLTIDPNLLESTIKRTLPEIYRRWKPVVQAA